MLTPYNKQSIRSSSKVIVVPKRSVKYSLPINKRSESPPDSIEPADLFDSCDIPDFPPAGASDFRA